MPEMTKVQNLGDVLVDIIAASRAIAWSKIRGMPLTKYAKELLIYSPLRLEAFADAIIQYDALPKGHETRKKAPYDLVHNANNDVVEYFTGESQRAA